MRVSRTIVLLLVPALLPMSGCLYMDVEGFGRFNRDFHFSFPMKQGGGHLTCAGAWVYVPRFCYG